ncbi:MAG: 6-phosphogluconolactonase [Alphaproteobacteria bacterium]|nr:6-phosphogluconolactonase [Alphaproteobacteria bacterium]
MPKPQIEVLPDPQSVAESMAAWIAERIAATSDVFRMALSGGNTPRLLYEVLGSEYRDRIEWDRVELFWGDERFVPHGDPRSNYRMARETLLARAPVLIDNIHPIVTDGEPDPAARRYELLLKNVYGAEFLSPERPLFDLVLLGLGDDGHTASLFPGAPALEEAAHWVVAAAGHDVPRITLTYPALESSRAVAFLVAGADKAEIVRRVISGDDSLPASRVRPQGEIVWFLDRAAASELQTNGSA